jgi:conjugal transfer/entry exclusion protein
VKASASEVKERFEQILLLRQIPQIENQTTGPYHTITVQLQNQVNFSKNEIIAILQEFNDFTSVDSGSGNRRGL